MPDILWKIFSIPLVPGTVPGLAPVENECFYSSVRDTENKRANDALQRAREIDAICDRFEKAIQGGSAADLCSEVEKVDEEDRSELFQQLLGIQLSLARKVGEKPTLGELLVEYSQFAGEVIEVYTEGEDEVETIQVAKSKQSDSKELLKEIQPESRYQMSGEVARGGMGAIHLAKETSLRRHVAVKTMLNPNASADELARFIEEAQITGQLDHPGIVPVHELGVDSEGRPYYVMKFVRGRDLQGILQMIGRGDEGVKSEFPFHRLLEIFDRACDAVAFAHAHGVIHRDLKPANIRVGEFGEVLLMDWGLAKLVGREDPKPDAEQEESIIVESVRGEDDSGEFLTLAGTVMGSPQ